MKPEAHRSQQHCGELKELFPLLKAIGNACIQIAPQKNWLSISLGQEGGRKRTMFKIAPKITDTQRSSLLEKVTDLLGGEGGSQN